MVLARRALSRRRECCSRLCTHPRSGSGLDLPGLGTAAGVLQLNRTSAGGRMPARASKNASGGGSARGKTQKLSVDQVMRKVIALGERERKRKQSKEYRAKKTVQQVRDDAIVATGRSDFPNQVNNVLGFPFIFRGALDVRARKINEPMKRAAADALAELARRGGAMIRVDTYIY